jgi:hypothetical protein
MANPATPNRTGHSAKSAAGKSVKFRKRDKAGVFLKEKVREKTSGQIWVERVRHATPKKAIQAKQTIELSDADIQAAILRGEEQARNEPRAQSAEFDRADRKIVISFANGTEFKFPPELAQGLEGATDDQLADVRVSGNGFGLHWESLDADLTVPGLVSGIFGTRRFMAQQAGRTTSAAKAAAARENGAKGGRPKKPAHPG